MTEIAKEYATALFTLSLEEGGVEEYRKSLELIDEVFSENPEYKEFLSSPSISLGERLSALSSVFEGKVHENLLSFLKLLCEKGRISFLEDAIKEYKLLYDASLHISTAKIISAVSLTNKEKEKLLTKLESMSGGPVNAEYEIDETIIGGIIIELDGKVLDGSLKHRLNEIKGVMSE